MSSLAPTPTRAPIQSPTQSPAPAAASPTVKLLIGGKFIESTTTEWRDIINPATQQVLARVPMATSAEVDAAVAAGKEAFKTWRHAPIGVRARIFLKYQQLIDRKSVG